MASLCLLLLLGIHWKIEAITVCPLLPMPPWGALRQCHLPVTLVSDPLGAEQMPAKWLGSRTEDFCWRDRQAGSRTAASTLSLFPPGWEGEQGQAGKARPLLGRVRPCFLSPSPHQTGTPAVLGAQGQHSTCT